VTDKRDNRLKH